MKKLLTDPVLLIVVLALALAAALLFTDRAVPEWIVALVLLVQVGTPSARARLGGQERLT